MGFRGARRIAILAAFFAGILPCFAGPAFFTEASGSYAHLSQANPFFKTGGATGSGFGASYGIWTTFTHRNPVTNIQFGLMDRFTTASASGQNDQLNSLYASIRIQLSRIYLGFAYSPYVMQSAAGSALKKADSTQAMYGEAGVLLPVTPRFSFALGGGYESISSGGSGPKVVSGIIGMRFYFGFSDGGDVQSNEFRGWRYPFGREKY